MNWLRYDGTYVLISETGEGRREKGEGRLKVNSEPGLLDG